MRRSRTETELSFDEQVAHEANSMNNFIAFLPGGFYRRIHRELIPSGLKYGEHLPEEEHEWRSELMLGQTPEEFFSLVDSLIEKHGVRGADINLVGADGVRKRRAKRAMIPVFIELREMGYTDYELNV